MARQLGAVRFIGRLANTVGYKARDGKGDAFDAVRNHTVEVTNPQTLSQMSQRMKLTPVQNFYRGLAGLLDHSWQGVKYGNPSRLHFYSLALRALSSAGCPYVNKGDKTFVPWQFPIAEGSIPVAMLPEVSDVNDGNMKLVISAESISNLGELTEALANEYIGIRSGMQLTFIWIYESNGMYVPLYKRLTLDAASNATLGELGFEFYHPSGENYYSIFNLNSEGNRIEWLVAAAGIIVSSLVNNTWERNTTTLVIADKIKTKYNSQAAFNAMLASYRTSKGSNESDWYLNGGEDEGGTSTVNVVKEATVTSNTGEKTIGYYKVGAAKYAPYYTASSEGQILVYGYRKGGDMAFTKQNAMTLGGFAALDDMKTEYLALGYTLCDRDELLAIAPELTIPE